MFVVHLWSGIVIEPLEVAEGLPVGVGQSSQVVVAGRRVGLGFVVVLALCGRLEGVLNLVEADEAGVVLVSEYAVQGV